MNMFIHPDMPLGLRCCRKAHVSAYNTFRTTASVSDIEALSNYHDASKQDICVIVVRK